MPATRGMRAAKQPGLLLLTGHIVERLMKYEHESSSRVSGRQRDLTDAAPAERLSAVGI
jgi:hypothetical protein